jgi:hypothetical protein
MALQGIYSIVGGLIRVSRILGHSTLKMLDIYGHSMVSDMEKAMSVLHKVHERLSVD